MRTMIVPMINPKIEPPWGSPKHSFSIRFPNCSPHSSARLPNSSPYSSMRASNSFSRGTSRLAPHLTQYSRPLRSWFHTLYNRSSVISSNLFSYKTLFHPLRCKSDLPATIIGVIEEVSDDRRLHLNIHKCNCMKQNTIVRHIGELAILNVFPNMKRFHTLNFSTMRPQEEKT